MKTIKKILILLALLLMAQLPAIAQRPIFDDLADGSMYYTYLSPQMLASMQRTLLNVGAFTLDSSQLSSFESMTVPRDGKERQARQRADQTVRQRNLKSLVVDRKGENSLKLYGLTDGDGGYKELLMIYVLADPENILETPCCMLVHLTGKVELQRLPAVPSGRSPQMDLPSAGRNSRSDRSDRGDTNAANRQFSDAMKRLRQLSESYSR